MRLPERLLAAVLLFAAGAAAQADPMDLKPFRATYLIDWKGITAGTSTLELKSAGEDTFVYSSVNVARGVFRMAFGDAITSQSTFRVTDGRIVPQSYRGSDEKERPVELDFDWSRKRVTGVAKERSVDLELQDGTQDPMSMQIASLRSLGTGTLLGSVSLVDSDKIKEYELRREGTARIETGLGALDTVVYTSQRAGGDRVTRTWVAPALGYLPVKAERLRKNKVEFTMRIESVDR
jgi:hypothetical protein